MARASAREKGEGAGAPVGSTAEKDLQTCIRQASPGLFGPSFRLGVQRRGRQQREEKIETQHFTRTHTHTHHTHTHTHTPQGPQEVTLKAVEANALYFTENTKNNNKK